MVKISAVIITFNEERYIEQCIRSVMDVADEIVVVDSLSTDRTPEICKNLGVKFIEQPFLGYKEQKNFALEKASYDYILSLDADEALSLELRNSILKAKNDWKFDGYKCYRLNNYCGQWMFHTSLYPERKLRLFDRRKGKWGGINPHDRFELETGSKMGMLKGDLLHWVYDSIEEHIAKINHFSTISSQEYFKLGISAGIRKIIFRTAWRFFHSYIIKAGFLEGFMGYVASKNVAILCYLKYSKLRRLIQVEKKSKKHKQVDTRVLLASNDNSYLIAGYKLEGNRQFNPQDVNKESPKAISVIITTYNQPEWLKKVLWGYQIQTYKNFEVVIADDGSGDETRNIIDWFKSNTTLNITHVWHPDDGFKKCTILNKAIIASNGDYLIFTDGDCIPRNDFIEVHVRKAKIGYFLSGGYLKLNKQVSDRIEFNDILAKNPFSVNWLLKNEQPFTYKFLKLTRFNFLKGFLNTFTTTKATWNGHNTSGWKADIVNVNGYNETMQYGGLDRELGERLMNNGIKGRQIRYSAICVHLDHPRPYKTRETMSKNWRIREDVKKNRITWTPNGIANHIN
ncbi:MAG TPA: glycosyltransferase [Tenuifilaceae bacterium]|nr:glycosyltransferase [Tenuifilaceae bacterium]HPQ34757.1 glycosyltransferase [Tenuifilaceae bacterium]HRX67524.1 glycosyltransferase [Tenuifilaceae bacterium]